MGIKSVKNRANVLIKFIDKEYIESTLTDGFFFNILETFKNSEGLTESQEDVDEGCSINFEVPNKGLEILDKNFKKVGHLNSKEIINFKLKKNYDFVLKVPICCFTLLQFPYDFTFIKKHKDIYEYKIKESVNEKLEGISGNRPYIYCLEQEMFKGLNQEIKSGRRIIAGKVKYYKEVGKNISESEVKKNPAKIIFMKNEKYKNQKEFRIALGDKKEPCFLKLSEVNMEKSKSINLDEIRLYINPKYTEEQISVQLANKDDEIIYII